MSSIIKFENKKKLLSSKDFLTIGERTSEEVFGLIKDAIELKNLQKSGTPHNFLNGKVLGMIFEKASTRTRVSFEVGMLQLGGHAIFLNSKDIQLGRGETIEDTAKVLARYVDGLMIRTFEHDTIERFAAFSSVPIINGLTDLHHPTQVMADLLTIYEHKGQLSGLKMCFVGDANNNMCHSLLEGASKVGMNISIACPKGYEPNKAILEKAQFEAKKFDSKIEIDHDPQKMIKEADIVVTDVFTSMGQENDNKQRLLDLKEYQVNERLCKDAKDDYIFLHCLPAHRGEEVTSSIIDGTHSVVFDEAENRLHVQKAILKALMV